MEKQFKDESANKGGVYRIRNKINGKSYIGSAACFKKRINQHENSLRNNKHQNKPLQHSFNKYGEAAFVFEVIEIINGSLRKRRTIEQKYINEIFGQETCYNIHRKTIKKKGPWSSTPEETKKKISEANKGKHFLSNEVRERMSQSHIGQPGYWTGKKRPTPSAETKKKQSEAQKRINNKPPSALGLKRSEETKQKMREAQKNRKPITEETRRKMSQSHKGIKPSKETLKKMSIAGKGKNNPFFGKKHPDELMRKIADKNRGKKHTEEHKNKISASLRKWWKRRKQIKN